MPCRSSCRLVNAPKTNTLTYFNYKYHQTLFHEHITNHCMITKTAKSIFNHYLVDRTSSRDIAHHYTTYCAFYDENYNDFTSWKASLHIIRSLFHRTRADTFKISLRLALFLFNVRCMFSSVMSAVSKSFVLCGFVTSLASHF